MPNDITPPSPPQAPPGPDRLAWSAIVVIALAGALLLGWAASLTAG